MHAGSIAFLDVLRKFEGNAAFRLDVVGDTVSTERDCRIESHDPALEDGHGTDSGTKVDQSHSILHLLLLQHSLGGDSGREIFLGDGNAHAVEYAVDVRGMSPVPDEHLEIAFQGSRRHSHDVAFQLIQTILRRERLGDSTVDDFRLAVFQGICLQSLVLEIPEFLLKDRTVLVFPFSRGGLDLLSDVVSRQSDDDF